MIKGTFTSQNVTFRVLSKTNFGRVGEWRGGLRRRFKITPQFPSTILLAHLGQY